MSTETSAEERLLTIADVAARLRMGQSKTWQLVRSGRIRSVKIGWSRRVPSSAVDEFIKELEREQAAGGTA